jgi:class 3 adenylate cyclase
MQEFRLAFMGFVPVYIFAGKRRSSLNIDVLASKAQNFLKSDIDVTVAQLFLDCIAAMPAEERYRMTRSVFVEQLGIDEGAVTALLMQAVKSDILIMEWHLICDACTGFIFSNEKFSVYEGSSVLCPFCCRYVTPDFQNNIEVTFSVHPSLAMAEPYFYADAESYSRHFFSRSFVNGGILPDIREGLIRWYFGVDGGKSVIAELDVSAGMEYNLFSMDCQLLYRLHGKTTGSGTKNEFVFNNGENAPVHVEIPAGHNRLVLTNNRMHPIGVCLLVCDCIERFQAVQAAYPLQVLPRLSGAQLLVDPHFIRLFGRQILTDNFSFKIGNLTILFTDLKSSTEMYGELGDMAAYNLVGKHFDILVSVIRENNGSLIKTIGDAVMSVFHNRIDAVRAAVTMHMRMDAFQNKGTPSALMLKIGMHYGTVLAVNANRQLDYFGQSVNIAARVQSQAHGGEICLSDAMLDDEVQRFLEEGGYLKKSVRKNLKGVKKKTTVYHYRITG